MTAYRLMKMILFSLPVFLASWLYLSQKPPGYMVQGATCPAGTTAYWRLDETAPGTYADAEDNHDGQCSGTACPVFGAGKVSGGQGFTRANQTKIDVPSSPDFDWGANGSFSIEYWVRGVAGETCQFRGNGNSDNEVVIGRVDAANQTTWWSGCLGDTAADAGKANFFLRDQADSVRVNATSSTKINDGEWHHVVVVQNGSTQQLTLYVDGVLEDTQTAAPTSGFASTQELNLGYLDLSSQFHFSGSIDEVAIYNRALVLSEIQLHHARGRAAIGQGYCSGARVSISKGPVEQAVEIGGTASFTVTVGNIGDVNLTNVNVADPQCNTFTGPVGDTGNDRHLGLFEQWHYECQITPVTAAFTNTATITAANGSGDSDNGSAHARVKIGDPRLGVSKIAHASNVFFNSPTSFTILVENQGDINLTNIAVDDPLCDNTLSQPDSGDSNTNNILDTGEIWTYTCTINKVPGSAVLPYSLTNVVTVTARSTVNTLSEQAQASVNVIASTSTVYLPLLLK